MSMSYIGYMYEKEKYIYALYNSNHKMTMLLRCRTGNMISRFSTYTFFDYLISL